MNTDSLKSHLQEKIKRDICLSILMESQVLVSPYRNEDGVENESSWLDNPWVNMGLNAGLIIGSQAYMAKRAAAKAAQQAAQQTATGSTRGFLSRIGTRASNIASNIASKASRLRPSIPSLGLAAPSTALKAAGAGSIAAYGAAGAALGLGAAYGLNRLSDALDPDTWKTGGSRAKTQVDLMTGDGQALRDLGNAIWNPIETSSSSDTIALAHENKMALELEQQRNQNRSQMEYQNELNKLKNRTDLSDEQYMKEFNELTKKYNQN